MSLVICGRCGLSFAPGASPSGMCPKCLLFGGTDEDLSGGEILLENVRGTVPGYEIVEVLGRGGMGTVFLAREEGSARRAAVKVIADRDFNPAYGSRFERESLTLAGLDHVGIVKSYGHGRTTAGHWYLSMEYVAGGDLRSRMTKGQLGEQEALDIIEQVCAALDYAHKRGLVHRDIKPGNILLNEEGRVKVADFGLVKILDGESGYSTLTHSFVGVGTPLYAAPEQLKPGFAVDHRADIYAVGVLLYEMLTGEVPRGLFQSPSRKSGVRRSWNAILSRALDARPEARFSSAEGLLSALGTVRKDLADPGARIRRSVVAGLAIAAACVLVWVNWPVDYEVRIKDSTIRIQCTDAGQSGRLFVSGFDEGKLYLTAPNQTFRSGVGFPKRTVGEIRYGDAKNIVLDAENQDVWISGRLALPPDASIEVRASSILLEEDGAVIAKGNGKVSFRALQKVAMKSGTTVACDDGVISMEANTDGRASGGFCGIDVVGGVIQVKGSGILSLRGTGGDSGDGACGVRVTQRGRIVGGMKGTTTVYGFGGRSPSLENAGVMLAGAGIIGSQGADVTVHGTGGNGEGSFGSAGIIMREDSRIFAGRSGELHVEGRGGKGELLAASGGIKVSLGSKIESEGGNVVVKGFGGTGTTNEFPGLWLDHGTIAAAGMGNVTVEGTAGTVLGGRDTTAIGVDVRFSSRIMSAGGNIQVRGIGSNPVETEHSVGAGVRMLGDGAISAGGEGAVTVEGTGGNEKSAGREGIILVGSEKQPDAARITSQNGPITLRAVSEGGLSNALSVGGVNKAQIACGGGHVLKIHADSVSITPNGRLKAERGIVLITPTSPGVGIHAGGTDVLDGAPKVLGIDNAELSNIEAQKIELGDAEHTTISVAENLSPENRVRLTPYAR